MALFLVVVLTLVLIYIYMLPSDQGTLQFRRLIAYERGDEEGVQEEDQEGKKQEAEGETKDGSTGNKSRYGIQRPALHSVLPL